MSAKKLILYRERDGFVDEVKVPTKFALCPRCEGRGTTTSHVEPDGGGFTASEWADACHDDEDFAENYRSGVYDRPCPECDGLRVVEVADEDKMSEADVKAWHAQLDDDEVDRALHRMEQRYGC